MSLEYSAKNDKFTSGLQQIELNLKFQGSAYNMAAPVFTFLGDLLHQAAIFDQRDLLKSLLEAGAHGNANSPDARGLTPLHTAALHDSDNCLAELLVWKGMMSDTL